MAALFLLAAGSGAWAASQQGWVADSETETQPATGQTDSQSQSGWVADGQSGSGPEANAPAEEGGSGQLLGVPQPTGQAPAGGQTGSPAASTDQGGGGSVTVTIGQPKPAAEGQGGDSGWVADKPAETQPVQTTTTQPTTTQPQPIQTTTTQPTTTAPVQTTTTQPQPAAKPKPQAGPVVVAEEEVYGRVRVMSNVPGVKFSLAGYQFTTKAGKALTIGQIPAGELTIEATKKGYQPWRKKVLLKGEQTIDVFIKLTKQAPPPKPQKPAPKVVAEEPSEGATQSGKSKESAKATGADIKPLPPEEAPPQSAAKPKSASLGQRFTNSVGIQFKLVRPGRFVMGTKLGLNVPEAEYPAHPVEISRPFYLSQHEVTQAQWTKVMGDNPSMFKDPKFPVHRITFHLATEFIRRLNAKEKTVKYRLPTEAEWEYACRAGTTTKYFFGPDSGPISEYAWYVSFRNLNYKPHPVGEKKPNPWGFYDMYGNVAELCSDWFSASYYQKSPLVDPRGPISGPYRVHRGGSYAEASDTLYSARRPNKNYEGKIELGFRLVREP